MCLRKGLQNLRFAFIIIIISFILILLIVLINIIIIIYTFRLSWTRHLKSTQFLKSLALFVGYRLFPGWLLFGWILYLLGCQSVWCNGLFLCLQISKYSHLVIHFWSLPTSSSRITTGPVLLTHRTHAKQETFTFRSSLLHAVT